MSTFKIKRTNDLVVLSERNLVSKYPINEREFNCFEECWIKNLFRPNKPDEKKIEYSAPAKLSILEYLNDNPSVHKIYSFILQTIETVKLIRRYNFFEPNLLLDANLVFVNDMSGEIFFVYRPVYNKEGSLNVFIFILDVLKKIKTPNSEIQSEILFIKDYLSDVDHFKLSDIEEMVKERYPAVFQEIVCITDDTEVKVSRNETSTNSTLISRSETTLLSGISGNKIYKLVSVDGMVNIPILKDQFVIGKSQEKADGVINNDAISRVHAQINISDNKVYLKDLESANKTYINGEVLLAGELKQVYKNDLIKFANQEFVIEGIDEERDSSKSKVIVFHSPYSFRKKFEVAYDVAVNLSKDEKVLFVSDSNIPTKSFCDLQEARLGREDIVSLKKSEGELNKIAKIMLAKINDNLFILPPLEVPLAALGYDNSLFAKIVNSFSASGEFKYIIFDMSEGFSEGFTLIGNLESIWFETLTNTENDKFGLDYLMKLIDEHKTINKIVFGDKQSPYFINDDNVILAAYDDKKEYLQGIEKIVCPIK